MREVLSLRRDVDLYPYLVQPNINIIVTLNINKVRFR